MPVGHRRARDFTVPLAPLKKTSINLDVGYSFRNHATTWQSTTGFNLGDLKITSVVIERCRAAALCGCRGGEATSLFAVSGATVRWA